MKWSIIHVTILLEVLLVENKHSPPKSLGMQELNWQMDAVIQWRIPPHSEQYVDLSVSSLAGRTRSFVL